MTFFKKKNYIYTHTHTHTHTHTNSWSKDTHRLKVRRYKNMFHANGNEKGKTAILR